MSLNSIFLVVAMTAIVPSTLGVYKGTPVHPCEFPFAVQLHVVDYEKPSPSWCGGSIVSSRVLLTAAHCVFNISDDREGDRKLRLKVRAGDVLWSPGAVDETNGQTRLVKHVFLHESYNHSTLLNDIAVLVLNYPLQMNEFVAPIRIPSQGQEFEGIHTVCGWGETRRSERSDVLLKARVQILSENNCKKQYVSLSREYGEKHVLGTPDKVEAISEAIICAAGLDGDGICGGDSGSPLICETGHQKYLCGIASTVVDEFCGVVQPTLQFFTAVANFSDWINKKIERFDFICDPRLEFNCGDGNCVPSSARCNREVECEGGTDEISCEPCWPAQFLCTGKAKCIDAVYVCDGLNDCGDDGGSDELGCGGCALDQFWCAGDKLHGNESCIHKNLVCDHGKHCPHANDEFGCAECTGTEFRCDSGECLDSNLVCDGVPSCRDASDEKGCRKYSHKSKTNAGSVHCDRNLDLGSCILLEGCAFNQERRECMALGNVVQHPSYGTDTDATPSDHLHSENIAEISTLAYALFGSVLGAVLLLGLGLIVFWRDLKRRLPPIFGQQVVPTTEDQDQAQP